MLKGKGVSNGIGFGNIIILKNQDKKIEKNTVKDSQKELERFELAFKETLKETQELVEKIDGTEKEIMSAYLMIMEDPTLIQETKNAITNLKYNAEYAVESGFEGIIQTFKNMEDEYMAARASDIEDIKNRILAKLLKENDVNIGNLPQNTIIVTKELTTSDTAKLDFKNVSGIITEIGGTNSHTSIMARTHSIPAIVRVQDATKIFRVGDYAAIDGNLGEIYLNPSEEEKQKLLNIKNKIEEENKELEQYKDKETITMDGTKFELASNIGTPADVELAIKNSAEAIGLFRSEFLYMDSKEMPTEEEQFKAYKEVAQKMQGKQVIIRTLDIGGDKELKYLKLEKEANPFLGYRAIRLCLDNIALFKIQLRAILKASYFGNLAIMFPMISSIEELREAKKILEECKKELRQEKVEFKEAIKIGIMIEIPSAAITAKSLAKECDFFSIGTNDLIQYTVAVERGNDKVAKLYNKYNPAVIKLIKESIDGAHMSNIFCGMCGEAAGDELLVPLLVGLGLDEFSMNSNKILKTRKTINHLNKKECEILAQEVLELSSAEEVENKLRKFISK